MQPRDYQSLCIEQLREGFRSQAALRQLLVSPTGSGKSLIFSFMAARARDRGVRTWVIAHRAEILDQIAECLQTCGVSCGYIRSGMPMNASKLVQVASIQTLAKRLDLLDPPEFIIIDEAHHVAAAQYKLIFSRFPNVRFVGVTATPLRLDGRGLREFFSVIVEGPSVQWLIDNGFLKRPIYYAPSVSIDVSGLKRIAGDYSKRELVSVMDKRSVTGDAVSHYLRLGREMPAIAFCITLAHAASVAESFNSAGIAAEVIDGKMTGEDRRARKRRLADGTTRVMVSCDLVSEGFDLPSVGCAILLRPTASLALHCQQIGRALRPHPGQDRAIVLDHAGNCLRHGLAEEPRAWSLDGKTAKTRPKEFVLETAQCVSCYAIYLGTKCPQCGNERVSKVREMEVKEGQLRELVAAGVRSMLETKTEEWHCRTYADYRLLGQRRGYKPAWAHFRWKASRYSKHHES